MAKPRKIEGLHEETPYLEAGARAVATRATEVRAHAAGVLDVADIERVHDMRVATRRLRAALEVFAPCFPKQPFKRALGEVKELADALGERRDRDVTIAALERIAASVGGRERPGIQSLIRELRREQLAANRSLAARVREPRLAALESRLLELADGALERSR